MLLLLFCELFPAPNRNLNYHNLLEPFDRRASPAVFVFGKLRDAMMTEPLASKISTQLVLPSQVSAELRDLAGINYPLEACGLLLGHFSDGAVKASRVAQARNLNHDRPHDRYLLDPADFVAADRAARGDGLEIIGIWHTHPNSPAVPSATDLEAAWSGYSYLIVAVSSSGETDMRSWRLEEDRFTEENIQQEDL